MMVCESVRGHVARRRRELFLNHRLNRKEEKRTTKKTKHGNCGGSSIRHCHHTQHTINARSHISGAIARGRDARCHGSLSRVRRPPSHHRSLEESALLHVNVKAHYFI